MSLKIAVQMDPLESINPASDSTLLLMREAARRGHALWHYTPGDLSWRDGKITARARPLKFGRRGECAPGAISRLDLSAMHAVLLRQDPPFNMEYVSTTYILEKLAGKALVVNDPQGVRDLPEKLFPLLLGQFMPPTLISADAQEIAAFRREQKEVVVKPLYGNAGRAIFRVKKDDGNFDALIEMMLAQSREPLMLQRFLPEVKSDDRRIIMIDGNISGVMGRIPAAGEIRANFRVGGRAAKATLTRKQKAICEALSPILKKHGQLFAGVDTIGDWLTEVNITSPTGMPAMNRLYGLKLEAEFWNAVEAKL